MAQSDQGGAVGRSDAEMVQALKRQVKLLKEDYCRVFEGGDLDYLARVAVAIRTLVWDPPPRRNGTKANTPLLLELMRRSGIEITWTSDRPWARAEPTTLGEYMSGFACMHRSPVSGEALEMTRIDLVRGVAEKLGGAHEDWELDEHLALAVSDGLFLLGQPTVAAGLRSITRTVLSVADEFLRLLQRDHPEVFRGG